MSTSTHITPLPSNDRAEEGGEFSIGPYLRILRKRIWVVGALIALGVTAVVFYSLTRQKVYQAIAKLEIDPQAPQVFGKDFTDVVQLGAQTTWHNDAYYNTQVKILVGYTLAEQTVITNRLYENPKILPPVENDARTKEEQIQEATTIFVATLSAVRIPETHIVELKVNHPDPTLAIELANKHLETFLAYTRSLRTEGAGSAAGFLAAELDTAQQRLKKTEEALLKFKKENDTLSMSLEDKESILAKDIERLAAAATEARVKKMELEALKRRVGEVKGEAVLESPVFGLAGGLTSNATNVGLLKDKYFTEKQKLVELAEHLGPKHPSYVGQKQRVDEILASIQNEASLAQRELDEKFGTFAKNEKVFESELARLKKETFELAPKSLEYARLVRQQKADEANYMLVLSRLYSSELSSRNLEINVRVHALARDTEQVYPRLRLNVVLGFLVSAILGICLAFLLEFMDRTLKSAEDVHAAVGAPFLGVIPVVDEVSREPTDESIRERDLYVFLHPTSRAAECCRSIRTNILFSSADRPMTTLTISSPRPREGKTTATIYLGSIIAQGGQRVLLVDTDLRRPRLHKSLGVSRATGLTNLIMNEVTIDDVVKTTDIPNLYVLPSGPTPPNPAELLLTQRFRDALAQLQARFDYILLDSPPVLAVTDGVILARLSDGVVLITQAGKTASDDARSAAGKFRDVDAPILGVILNDMDLSDRRYGYYYYYHYGYGEKIEAEPETSA